MDRTAPRNVNEDNLPEAVQPIPMAYNRGDGDDSPLVVLREIDGKVYYNPDDPGLEAAPTPSSGKGEPGGLRGLDGKEKQRGQTSRPGHPGGSGRWYRCRHCIRCEIAHVIRKL